MKTKIFEEKNLGSWVSKGSNGIGFEEIESRKHVIDKIESFIKRCEVSKGLNACNIIGEWGQGKTELYHGFIKEELDNRGHKSFLVSASTLSNILEDKEIVEIIKKSPLSAVRTLATIFEGVSAENENFLPSLKIYDNPEDYIKDTLDSILGLYDGSQKMFIFIDEFEELLNNLQIIKSLISGIKELINGNYKEIDVDGEFSGSVHLFISLTPDAKYRLETDAEISLIAGGYGRRVDQVELATIRKQESIEFLRNYISEIYDGKEPNPYPMGDIGIFDTLHRLSLGNLGNLKSLLIKLLNKFAHYDEDFFEVVEYDNFIEFLKETDIYVFGGQSPCIDSGNYKSIIEYLEDTSELSDDKNKIESLKKLFTILIAYLRPFTVQELTELVKVDEADVYKFRRIINEKIKRDYGIDEAIIEVFPVREDLTFEKIKEKLSDYIKTDDILQKEVLLIGDYSEPLDQFEDSITFFDFDSDSLTQRIFLPATEEGLRELFKNEVSKDYLLEMESLFKGMVDENRRYLIISNTLLDILYPTPIPRFLGYILKKDERLSLWRRISLNLAEEYKNNIERAFIDGLKKYENITVADINDSDKTLLNLYDPDIEVDFKLLTKFVQGDVKEDHIQEIAEILKNDFSIHGCLLVYSGDFTGKARESLSEKDLDKVIKLHLHQTLTKRLLCSYRAPKDSVDESLRDIEFGKIFDELKLKETIKEWLKNQKEKGLVVEQIATKSLPKFADTLKLYLNYINEPLSPEEVLNKNLEGILKFKFYGTKKGFIASDLEDSPKEIIEISNELYEHGFLERVNGDKYKAIEHPVEKRIYEIIKKKGKIRANDLKLYFILKSKSKNIFSDLFLNILEYKNKINKINKNEIEITNPETEYEELKNYLNRFNKELEGKNNLYKSFAHVFMTKKRGHKLITLDEFKEFIQENYSFIEDYYSHPDYKEAVLTKIFICKKLLMEIFYCKKNQRCLKTFIENASKECKKSFENIENMKNEIERDIRRILGDCEKVLHLKIDGGVEGIKEYDRLSQHFERVKGLYGKEYSKEELENTISNLEAAALDEFKFNNSPSSAYYYNLKLYFLRKEEREFQTKKKDIDARLRPLWVKLEDLKRKKQDVLVKLSSIQEEPKLELTNELFKELHSIGVDTPEERINPRNLNELKEKVKERVYKLRDRLEKVDKLLYHFDELMQREKSLLERIDENEQILNVAKRVFDDGEKKELGKHLMEFDSIKGEYRGISLQRGSLRDVLDHLTELGLELRTNQHNIMEIWKNYRERQLEFINDYERVLELVKIDEDLRTELESLIGNFKETLKEDIKDQEVPASRIDSLKSEVRNEFERGMKNYLSSDELELLKEIDSMKGKGVIDYEKIKERALEKDIDFEKAHEGLIQKGYIKLGFYFPS